MYSSHVKICVANSECLICAVPANVSIIIGEQYVVALHQRQEIGTAKTWAEPSRNDLSSGTILHQATAEDFKRKETNEEVATKALAAFQEKLVKNNIPARAVKAHFSFRRERLIVWIAAEATVELASVTGDLQRQFATRVETRQLGWRDEAAILGGFGPCGRSMCCSTWLKKFQPVTIDMAREQGLSTNPVATNGMCGCLRCCLRYELKD